METDMQVLVKKGFRYQVVNKKKIGVAKIFNALTSQSTIKRHLFILR